MTINFGMHHFPHPERALAEAHRALQPGGHIAFTAWGTADSIRIVPRMVQQLGDAAISLPTQPPDLFGDPARCEHTLRAAGFLSPTIVTLQMVQRIEDPEAYFEIVLKGAGPRQGTPLRAQSPETIAAIRAAVVRELRTYEQDGVIHLPMPAILFSAQKP